MNARIALIFSILLALTGCGSTVVLRPVPVHTMQFSRPAEVPVPPPAAYLQRGLGCKLVNSYYQGSSRNRMAVKVDTEECHWLQWSQTGHQQKCDNHSRFTTYVGKDQLPGTLPETNLEKVTNCTWHEGRGRCHLRVEEDAKLFPEIHRGVLRSYRKVYLNKPSESLRCR